MLIAVMLFTFVATAALTVDISYMHLVKAELRAATDAAAKAGAEALARTEDEQTALTAVKQIASANTVAGRPLVLADSDVEFGRVTRNNAGRFQFDDSATPANAVRINARLADDASSPAAELFFAGALGHEDFTTSQSATASQQDVEVCLCLDRSGSMMFDMSGVDWAYPPNNPGLSNFTAWGSLWRNYLSPPHPTDCRWAVMVDAINLFLDVAGSYRQPPRVGLVTWGDDYTNPRPPYTHYPSSTLDVAVPPRSSMTWQANSDQITNLLTQRSQIAVMGGTNMSSGIDQAVQELTSTTSSRLANKVLILLSDGVWNAGRDPELAAADARDAGVVIHSISMLSSDQATLRNVASTTGGRFYVANDQATLRSAFEELAATLPILLTD